MLENGFSAPYLQNKWMDFDQTCIAIFRVLTRILRIGVKCGHPEKVGVLPYFSIETFQKVGIRNEKLE